MELQSWFDQQVGLIRERLPAEALRARGASRDFLVYAAGNLLAGGMSFVLVPVYTRVLEKSQYGAFDIVSVSMSLVGSFLTLGLNQLIGVRYFQSTGEERNRMISDLLALYFLIATPLTALILFGSGQIAATIFSSEVSGAVILVASLAAYLSFLDSVGFSLLQQEKRARLYASVSVVRAAFVLGTSILLVVVIPLGVLGVLMGVLAGKLVGSVLLVWNWTTNYWAAPTVKVSRLRSIAQSALTSSLPLMLSGILTVAMVAAERYVIRALAGTASLGTYSVSAKFAQVYEVLLVVIVARVYSPRILDLFRREGELQAERLNARMSLLYLAAAAMAGAAMSLALWLLFPWLVGGDYQESVRYVPLLIGAKLMLGMRNFAAYYLLFTEATRRILSAYVVGIVAIVALDFALIPGFGLMGAAVANVLASSTVFLATHFLKRNRLAKDVTSLSSVSSG